MRARYARDFYPALGQTLPPVHRVQRAEQRPAPGLDQHYFARVSQRNILVQSLQVRFDHLPAVSGQFLGVIDRLLSFELADSRDPTDSVPTQTPAPQTGFPARPGDDLIGAQAWRSRASNMGCFSKNGQAGAAD